jgi:hypothetical protein
MQPVAARPRGAPRTPCRSSRCRPRPGPAARRTARVTWQPRPRPPATSAPKRARIIDERSESLDGLRPERTHALLGTLAAEQDIEWPLELEVARSHVEELLHAGPGVEEHKDERVVTTAVGSGPVEGLEERTPLVGFEILDEALSCPLEGDGEDLLAQFELLGVACGRVPRKCMDGREAGVARGGRCSRRGTSRRPRTSFVQLPLVSCGKARRSPWWRTATLPHSCSGRPLKARRSDECEWGRDLNARALAQASAVQGPRRRLLASRFRLRGLPRERP